MFPTRVGMNREDALKHAATMGVPHTRGDEPKVEAVVAPVVVCSPHAWG